MRTQTAWYCQVGQVRRSFSMAMSGGNYREDSASWRVHFTNRSHRAQFNKAPKKASCYVRTPWHIADVFGEFFFVTFSITKATLYRNLRH